MGSIAFDTTFLIDLQREAAREGAGPAHLFLESHRSDELCLPVIAWAEYMAGFDSINSPFMSGMRQRFRLLPVDEGVAVCYRQAFRFLKQSGKLIGANDLWIGCTALHNNLRISTENADDFSRIPGLQVVRYKS